MSLTAKEFALLRYFMTRVGEVLSQEELLDHVWDENADPFTNTVRVTVGHAAAQTRSRCARSDRSSRRSSVGATASSTSPAARARGTDPATDGESSSDGAAP